MLPASWKPHAFHPLVRLGSPIDGGYVVSTGMVRPGVVLISMGLNDDWTFESDFLRRGGGEVHCFDHTVNPKFWALYVLKNGVRGKFSLLTRPLRYRQFFQRLDAHHHQEKVGYESDGGVPLARITSRFSPSGPLALKIDIEGSEYRVLSDIVDLQDRLTGIVIEFHDVDLHRDAISDFVERLDQFDPVWAHPNNWAGVDPYGDPIVLEMSFARRTDRAEGLASAAELTTANDPRRPEIVLQFQADS